MNRFWTTQARRINKLTLRERAIMFVSLSVALVAAADALVLSPRLAEQRAMTQQLQQAGAEMQTLRQRLAASAQDASPAGRLQRDLTQLRGEEARINQQIAQQRAAGETGTRLPALLERVLRRNERLLLLQLATAPPAANPRPEALPLQAVDLAVRGSYLDLTQYVAECETTLPGLRWAEVVIKRNGSAAELSARVMLLGDTP